MFFSMKKLVNISVIFISITQGYIQAAEIRNSRNEIITLDASLTPAQNFDLKDWSLSLPIDRNKDGIADNIPEKLLSRGVSIKPLFYTADDGGMVFLSPSHGPKTSKNTKYSRTELREMLRKGNTSIKTKGVTKNNWVFSTAKKRVRKKAGAVDGTLDATLAVNHVTTTGIEKEIGRVIIGQIHATKDEPIRLYYRKLPNHTHGSIYMAHEPLIGDEQWYDLIGSRSSKAKNPVDGIALDEVFSYRIAVDGNDLTLTIIRSGKADIVQHVDMSKSGYKRSDQYMYFKAGVYNQNKTSEPNDYVQATFYQLENKH